MTIDEANRRTENSYFSISPLTPESHFESKDLAEKWDKNNNKFKTVIHTVI